MYGYKKVTAMSFTETLNRTKEELKNEGFGVLTEIDVKATLKKKLDVDYDDYIILGACNPSFAHKALQAEKDIGLLLPCNVIIYSDNGQIVVSAILPSEAMGMVHNAHLKEIALAVEHKLKNVIDKI